jgi:hypothetical protein
MHAQQMSAHATKRVSPLGNTHLYLPVKPYQKGANKQPTADFYSK